ncbi:MAG: guanylate kinase [Deltaproteobacteria bacterium]|nr:guanylate kinase [Deltaproteobacteria bacterium]
MEIKRKEGGSKEAREIHCYSQAGLILVVSAPSGAGKTTICRKFLKNAPNVRFSVSSTTRKPRRGEVNGSDYHFISEEKFREGIAKGEFIEWEINYGYLYGTSKKRVEELLGKGYDILFDLDTRGAKNLKSLYPDAVFVFILPPSMNALRERLEKRGSEKGKILEMRIGKAMEEIRENKRYDYVIFNDNVGCSVDVLKAIYVAERHRGIRLNNRIISFV